MLKPKEFVGIKFSAIIFLTNVFLLLKSVSSNVCTTPGCRKASSDVLSFIDPSVDPCQDFYKFTCGGIFKKTHEAKPVSLEAMVKKEVDDQTNLMLIKPIDPSEPRAIQALKKFFISCMDEAAIEKHGFSSFRRALGLLRGWPVVEGTDWNEDSFSLEELLVKLRRMGYNFKQLFYIRTIAGEEEQSLVVDEPIIEPIEEKDIESYHNYMVDTAIRLGADKHTASSELEETLHFQDKLLHILEKRDQLNKTTIYSIQEKFPFLNWLRFINNIIYPNIRISEFEEIYFPSTKYLKNLENLLKTTSNRTLANYLIWKAVEALEPYLPKGFRDIKRQYLASPSNGEEEEDKSRLEFCRSQTQETLRPTFEALFVREYLSHGQREKAQEIVNVVRDEFIKILSDTDLYDDQNKSKMLEKADSITYSVGGPERVFDEHFLSQLFDDKESLNTYDFLTIASILNRQSDNLALKFGGRIEFYNYYKDILQVRAIYSAGLNTIVLPAAILQGLYFSDQRPLYLNFGTIGTTLGSELIHGFTEDGSQYENGPYHADLWTNSTKRNFRKKAGCLIQEASNFEIENSELHMDGQQVLDETVCDYTGIEIAYRAYDSWVKDHGEEKQLPGLNYTPKQLFWISAASTFCDTVPLDRLRDFIQNEKKAHPTFRTFGAFSNNEHFGKDFDCPVGSRMNPANKCQLF